MGVPVATRQTAAAQRADPQRSPSVPGSQGGACSQTSSIAHLQRTVGNRAISRVLQSRTRLPSGTIQPKLTVSHPEDESEREADRVADQVMRMPERSHSFTPLIHASDDELEGEKIHTAAEGGKAPALSGMLRSELQRSQAVGDPIPERTRSFFERRFGANFQSVRIHTGTTAAQMNRSIHAKAFTHANHIYFSEGRYDPSSHSGKSLLAHELTHVIQQASPGPLPAGPGGQVLSVTNSPAATTAIQRDADDTPQEAKRRALAIKDALLDHLTEDEEAALNQIRNQSILMIKEIRAQYSSATGGRSLVEDFKEYVSSSEFKEALSLLNAVLPLEDRLRTNINKGWLVNTENEKGMLEVLRKASRAELDDAVTHQNTMGLLRRSLNDVEFYEARKILTPGELYEAVIQLIKNAESFWGDNEKAVYNALLDLTQPQRERLWKENKNIFSFMNDTEKASVAKMCGESEAVALKERMKVATEGLGTDDDAVKLVAEKTKSSAQKEQAVKQALASGKAPDGKALTAEQVSELQAQQRAMGDIRGTLLTAEYEGGELKEGSFLEMLRGDISAEEYQSFAGTMGVSQYLLIKQQVLDAIGTFTDDDQAIYKAFDRLVGQIDLPSGPGAEKLSAVERAQSQKLANQRLRRQLLADPDVQRALKGSLNQDELKEVEVHASADTYQIALKNLEAAYHGVDTDEERIFKILTEMSDADRKRFQKEQPRIHYDLLFAPSSTLTSEEKEMVRIAIETGKIPTDKALNWAFGGWGDGTEDEMLEQTFEAMDETERYEYRLGYFLFKGGSLAAPTEDQKKQQQIAKDKFGKLYQRMDAELGDDDLQKALDQLLGTPTLEELRTEQGRLMAAGIMGYRVGQKGAIRAGDTVSSAIMDTFSESGEMSDQSEARFKSAYRQAMADGVLTDEEFALLAALDADFAEKYQAYVASVDQVANVASTVAAIVVGIVATVASGGSAGPAVASLLSQYGAAALTAGVASAATKVAVAEAVGGSHFDTFSTEGLLAAGTGFADGATAVLSAGLAARFTTLIGLGKGALAAEMTTGILLSSNAALAQAGKTFVSAGIRSSIEGFLAGAAGELVMTTADEKTWKQSIWGVLQTYGLNILKGGGIGAATGAISGGTLEALGTHIGVKRVQALVAQLEASGVSQQRMSMMSLRSVRALGEVDAALAAGEIDKARAVLTSLQGEMSAIGLESVWRSLGKYHTGSDLGLLFPAVKIDFAAWKARLLELGIKGDLDAIFQRAEGVGADAIAARGELQAAERARERGLDFEFLSPPTGKGAAKGVKTPEAKIVGGGAEKTVEVKTATEPPQKSSWNATADKANKQIKAGGKPGEIWFDWTEVDLLASTSDFKDRADIERFLNGKMTTDRLKEVSYFEILWRDNRGNVWITSRTRAADGTVGPVTTVMK